MHYAGRRLTSNLLFEAENDGDSLMKNEQFGLGLLALQVQLTHAAQLFERLVDVPDSQPLAGVVGHPPLTLALRLLLGVQVLVFIYTAAEQFTAVRRDGGNNVASTPEHCVC